VPDLSAQDRLVVAETVLRLGRTREAADLAKSTDKELADSPRLALFRGDLQRQYGSLEDAALAYREAIDKGEPARGLVGLALVAGESDPAEAETRLRQALAVAASIPDADVAQLQAALAALLAQTGRFPEAISWGQRAIQSEQVNVYVRWAELGQLYSRHGDAAAAQSAFRQSLALEPYGYDAHAGLATLYMTAGRLEDAAREFRFLLRFHPLKDIMLWETAADALRRAGHQQEADRVLSRGRVLFPK